MTFSLDSAATCSSGAERKMELRPSVSHLQKTWSGEGEPSHGRSTVRDVSTTQPIVSAAAMEPMPSVCGDMTDM